MNLLPGKQFLIRLKYFGNGLVMAVKKASDGAKVIAQEQDNSSGQLWTFDEKGRICSANCGLFLEESKESIVLRKSSNAVMKWNFTGNNMVSGLGSKVRMNSMNEFSLDSSDNELYQTIEVVRANIPVYQTLSNYIPINQRHSESLVFYICSTYNQLLLDVQGKSSKENSGVISWDLNGQENQQWSWKDNHIVSKSTNMALGFHHQSGRIVIQTFQDIPEQLFFLTKVKFGYLIQNINGDCLRLKWGMINKRSHLVLHPYVENDLSMIWEFDYMPSYTENPKIKELGGWGDRARQLILRPQHAQCLPQTYEEENNMLRKELFWKATKGDLIKYFRSEYYINQEIAGANLCNYISGGLSIGCRKSYFKKYFGVEQSWTTLDNSYFKKMGTNPVDFSILSHDQLHELFVHVISDRLASNWDTHHKNYAVSKDGHVVSFDKEQSFEKFSLKEKSGMENNYQLDLTSDIWSPTARMNKNGYFYINKPLVEQILQGKVKINPNHQVIQECFERCESMTYTHIEIILGKYASIRYKDRRFAFLTLVLRRINDIRRGIHDYFQWPLNDDHLARLKQVPRVWK